MQKQLQAEIDHVKAESYDAIMQSNRALNQLAQENQALKHKGDSLYGLLQQVAEKLGVDLGADDAASTLVKKVESLVKKPPAKKPTKK